ncbi:hypothetical protein [Staphylococcus capitis]|uniref:Phage protein n=2 Tax=Staphylococcus capitis TaxID=29388 RepID=A0ABX1SSJ5_STACP|nr:hypothetical protein [Staphylococcus capitis]NMK54642.1 hypothetical protein [Staphylococcus capitis]NMK69931.1 hypothetical protein [Staphylococcus capitis]NMK85582.1 hypothetical protein [Staphylococcus capitis]
MKYIVREDCLNNINAEKDIWLIDEENMRLVFISKYNIKEMKNIKQKRNGMIKKLANHNYDYSTGYMRDYLIMEHCMKGITQLPNNKFWIDSIKNGITRYPFKQYIFSEEPIEQLAKTLQKEIKKQEGNTEKLSISIE